MADDLTDMIKAFEAPGSRLVPQSYALSHESVLAKSEYQYILCRSVIAFPIVVDFGVFCSQIIIP